MINLDHRRILAKATGQSAHCSSLWLLYLSHKKLRLSILSIKKKSTHASSLSERLSFCGIIGTGEDENHEVTASMGSPLSDFRGSIILQQQCLVPFCPINPFALLDC
mmetsp:Transcript_10239/g.28213  ORF Transcript_10239/g.28213 Transcript_10239/m.28213 type:complete len:107 (-) Transcript_10239:8-328(-)